MGFWYFLRNVLKAVLLLVGLVMLQNFNSGTGEEVAGNIGIAVFLFFLFFEIFD